MKKIFSVTSNITMGFIIAFSTPNRTEAQAMDFSQQIEALAKTQRATVILVPDETAFAVRLNAETLREFGCGYSSNEPAAIAELVNNITKKVSLSSDGSRPEERQGIYLELTTGEMVEITFGRNQASYQGQFSIVAAGKANTISIDSSFLDDIRHWAAKAKEGFRTEANKNSCSDYINRFK